MKKQKIKWTSATQLIWECFSLGVRGLRRIELLTLREKEYLEDYVQKRINKRAIY